MLLPPLPKGECKKHKAKIKIEGRNKDVEMRRAGGTAALLSQALPPSQLLPNLCHGDQFEQKSQGIKRADFFPKA